MNKITDITPEAAAGLWSHPDGGTYVFEGKRKGKHPDTGAWLDGVDYRCAKTDEPYWTTLERFLDRFTPITEAIDPPAPSPSNHPTANFRSGDLLTKLKSASLIAGAALLVVASDNSAQAEGAD